MAGAKRIDKFCCDCGIEMKQVPAQQQRCLKCKKAHRYSYKRTSGVYKEVGIPNIRGVLNK